ncbi:hypothetical protein [Solidesulfovibrio carbinolicus]|uniref:hypothetical protein n=1 Tax=Solidesulfovibrio carbinolicus TaxID=296842 RepID=UPI0010132149|nr:hypothetical protein [Solidesulfovibrio carbinolicus]
MRELCTVTQSRHPLRILLLERQAEEQRGWLYEAFPGDLGHGATGPRDLLDGPPKLLPGLCAPDMQRGIMQNMLDRLGSRVVLSADNADFQAKRAATD